MAYDVDFWYLQQDACEISTDFTPFSEREEESIYMKTSDFFEMIERFTDPDLERKAKAFDEIKKRFEKEYKAEVLEESLYYPENFDNSEFLVDVEHILYFEDVRYVKIKEDK